MNRSLTEPPARGRAHPRRSATDRFEAAYRACWTALRSPTDPDLAPNELALLHEVGDAPGGVALTWLAAHLGWPKSTTSVLVKDLERRGWLARARRDDDERRLAIALTDAGRARVASDRILDARRLTAALRALSPTAREQLLEGLDELAVAAGRLPAGGSGSAR